MKICVKMHARAEVMPNRVSKVGHFPLTRQNIVFVAQPKAEMLSHKWRVWSQFGYGNILLHTIFAKTVLRKCASHRRRGAHFYKFCKKLKKKHANKHQKSNFLKQIVEIAKMNCKLWLQNGLKSKKCSRPTREQPCFVIFSGGRGPDGGGLKGPMHPKVTKN